MIVTCLRKKKTKRKIKMPEIIDLKEKQSKGKCRQQEAWEKLGKFWDADTLTILNKEERFYYLSDTSKYRGITAKKGYVLTWNGETTNVNVISDGTTPNTKPELLFNNPYVNSKDLGMLGKAIWALEEIQDEPNKYHHGRFWSVFDN